MTLSAFVLAQIVFDVAVVVLLAALSVLVRKRPRPPDPPEWYAHVVKIAHDLMTATEPVLDRLEERGPPAPIAVADRYREARTLLESGARPDDVAARAGLRPGELRLLANVVAAEARIRLR